MIGPLGLDYKKLIKEIDANITMFSQIRSMNQSRRWLVLRHDVDHDLEKALEMARYEASIGLQSTYFLLHSAPYYVKNQKFKDQCCELLDLGHEIGFHNNVLVDWIQHEGDIRENLQRFLDVLYYAGVNPVITSSHGARDCRLGGFNNYELWKEFPGDSKIDHNPISLADFGFQDEVYFMPFDFYWSDSGSKWRGGSVKVFAYWFERDVPFITKWQQFFGDIQIFNKLDRLKKGWAQLLTHPKWWKV
jgi:hypothetical protein